MKKYKIKVRAKDENEAKSKAIDAVKPKIEADLMKELKRKIKLK